MAKRIVFMGTADFSLKSLKVLFEKNYNIVAVYTQPPKPSGRNYKIQKSVVHEFAESCGIPVFTPKTLRSPEQLDIFQSLKADVAIVSSYGLIIPRNILDVLPYGFINIHTSILPRWRGAAPIQSAILSGDKQTGITIIKMGDGIDDGDIISMKFLDIHQKTNHGELSEKMGDLGAEMIVDILENLEISLSNAYKQPQEGATYAPKFSKESCRIDWSNAAEIVLRQIMAFSPDPSAWTEIEGIRIKILDADVVESEYKNKTSGELFEENKNAVVSCGSGFLKLTTIQPAGKNIMSGSDFIRGHKNLIGKSFI